MIKLKNNLQEFISVFKLIEKLVIEVNLTFGLDGLYIRAVHPSNHCFVIFNINKSFFEEYNVEEEKTYTIDVVSFNKIIRKIKGKEGIEVDVLDDGIILKNSKNEFILNNFVGKEDDRLRPDIETTSKWNIDNDFFINITDLTQFSDVIKIEGNDTLKFHTKSNLVKGKVDIEAEKIDGGDVVCYYDINYIEIMKDINNIFDKLRFGFGENQPLVIKGKNDYIDFEFMLACRVEENE